MENNIVLIHAGIAVLFLLLLFFCWTYCVLRNLIKKNKSENKRSKFLSVLFYGFLSVLFITGLYPLIVLGNVELYHILKLFALVLIWWLLFRAKRPGFITAMGLSIFVLILSGFSSFLDAPKIPQKKGVFEMTSKGQNSDDPLDKGKVIYSSLCVQCHGVDGKLGKFQAADLTQSTLSQPEKVAIITNGSPLTVMASYEQLLTTDEILAVASYAHSLHEN